MKKLKEKALEDLLCSQPNLLGDNIEILGRQIPLPHGRLDILAFQDERWLLAIELKAVPLQEKDIGQILRYTSDLQGLLRILYPFFGVKLDNPLDRHINKILHASHVWSTSKSDSLTPVLIGPSANENVLSAAHGGGIEVKRWHRHEDTIQIEPIYLPDDLLPMWKDFPIPEWGNMVAEKLLERSIEQATHGMHNALFSKVDSSPHYRIIVEVAQ